MAVLPNQLLLRGPVNAITVFDFASLQGATSQTFLYLARVGMILAAFDLKFIQIELMTNRYFWRFIRVFYLN